MEIYLVRHTTPDVPKGVCYGQADLDVTATFYEEAAIIKKYLPQNVAKVHSSPLKRCAKLATHLYQTYSIELHDDLKEINCGRWEMQLWDDIPKAEIAPWMADFVNVPTTAGESYTNLYNRVCNVFENIKRQELPAVIIAHGGVIRSILSNITNTPLIESFNIFKIHYGCVVKLMYNEGEGKWQHEILSNIVHEKETHQPSKS